MTLGIAFAVKIGMAAAAVALAALVIFAVSIVSAAVRSFNEGTAAADKKGAGCHECA
jgi:hypothetical protein